MLKGVGDRNSLTRKQASSIMAKKMLIMFGQVEQLLKEILSLAISEANLQRAK